jgi:hypothetical protein
MARTLQDADWFAQTQAGYLSVYALSVSGDGTSYYAFENNEGGWYITKAVASGTTTTFTYSKGTSDVATAWTNRASQTYALPSVTWA